MAAPGIPPAGGDVALTNIDRIRRDHGILVSQYGDPLVARYLGEDLERRMNRLNAREGAFDDAYADAIARGLPEANAQAIARQAADDGDVDNDGVPYTGPPPPPLTPAERERGRLYNIVFFNQVGPPITPVEVYRRRANEIQTGTPDAGLTPWPTLASVHAHAASIGLMPIAEGGGRRRRASSTSSSSSSSSSSSGRRHSRARRTKSTRSARVRGRR
jgi:hypothetical protein